MKKEGWFAAAECGDVNALQQFVDQSQSILDNRDGGGWTALCHAAFNGHVDAVAFLIECGADVRLNFPIHYSGQRQHREVCRLLVNAGAVDDVIPSKPPAVRELWRAVYSFDQAEIERLATAELVKAKDGEGASLLHVAAIHGDVETVRRLISLGIDVNATYGDEATAAIREASGHAHIEVCDLLLAAGAKVDLFDACLMGATDLLSAILKRDASLVNEHRGGVSLLETVTEAGLVEVGRLLVTYGAELCICTAASLGDVDAVTRFLDDDPTQVSAKRKLFAYEPIHCAAECGHPDVIQVLLDRGADVNARNEWGFTPLHLAIIAARDHAPTESHHSACNLLIRKGADLDATDDYGSTVIGLATGTVDYNSKHGLDLTVPKQTLALIESSLANPPS